jgi:SAM-dependent methyltransferase
MNHCFNNYSTYYNLLYKDKDYKTEVNYITSLIKSAHPTAKTLLDVGCGTGKHLALLARQGFDCEGIDLSETMLQEARSNFSDIFFTQADARNFNLDKKFDVVTSLFHVVSYQTKNDDFLRCLKSIRTHLRDGGVFVFDFWYGPAVLIDPPVTRIKRLESDEMKVTRLAESKMHYNNNVVDVHYEILIENKHQSQCNIETINETHSMRYFFLPEIDFFLAQSNFKIINTYEWLKSTIPSEKSWNICVIAKAL